MTAMTIEPITVDEYVKFPVMELKLQYYNMAGKKTFFEIVCRDPKTDINWLAHGVMDGLHTNIDDIIFADEWTLTPVVLSTPGMYWTPYK